MGFVPAVEEDPLAFTVRGVAPRPVDTVKAAVGGVTAVTWAVVDACDAVLSFTVTVTVKVPGELYVWPAVAPACGPTIVPSPKLKVYVAMPMGSVDAEASAATTSGVAPNVGETCSFATGAPTVTCAVADDIYPAVSVTVTLTTKAPPAL